MRKNVASFSFVLILLGIVPSESVVQQPEVERQLQSSTTRVIAEAYECDDYLNALSDDESLALMKTVGYEIRVCIRPTTPTLQRGIVMKSIHDFQWSHGSTIQPAILKGYDLPRTLHVCVPGRQVCSFKTRFIDDFFYGESGVMVTGTGTVSMQEAVALNQSDTEQRRHLGMDKDDILQAMVKWTDDRTLQAWSTYDGFSGTSEVKMSFNLEVFPSLPSATKDDRPTWWQDSPSWLKALVIGMAIILAVVGCCLSFVSYMVVQDCMGERVDEEESKSDNQEVKERVGQKTTTTKLHSRRVGNELHSETCTLSVEPGEENDLPPCFKDKKEEEEMGKTASTPSRDSHRSKIVQHWDHTVSLDKCQPSRNQ